MISLQINGILSIFSGNPETSLLDFLRNEKHITSAKDGCSANHL
jgi:aerobic-type carbon monoxide dehydrogenase small subunit (CoxS/CutS family)